MTRLRQLLSSRRRLKFTREGKYFVALTFGIGFAAINTGNNLLYMLLGMMLALIVGSGVLSELSLSALSVKRKVPDRIYAERPFLMGIKLENPKRRLPSFSIEVEDMLTGQPLDKKCYFLKVPPGRTQLTSYRHTFPRRGLYEFSGFLLSTRFPFTFFRKSKQLEHPGEVLVFPAVHAVFPPSGLPHAASERKSYRLDRRGEFFALREYAAGDDPRDIHWRKSARVGRMVVRQHEDQRGQRIAIFLDNRERREVLSPADKDQEERTVSLAASLAVHYIRQGFTVALVSRTVSVRPGEGQAHLTRILRALALVQFIGEDRPFAAPPRWPGETVFVSLAGCSVSAPPGMAA
jgi:uncharacterized protein (DUF58 family)